MSETKIIQRVGSERAFGLTLGMMINEAMVITKGSFKHVFVARQMGEYQILFPFDDDDLKIYFWEEGQWLLVNRIIVRERDVYTYNATGSVLTPRMIEEAVSRAVSYDEFV